MTRPRPKSKAQPAARTKVRVAAHPGTLPELCGQKFVSGRFARTVSAFVQKSARAMLGALDLRGVELSVLLVPDTRMRELNRLWRNLDRVTNVLSFPQLEPEQVEDLTRGERPATPPPGQPVLLGDVVLALTTIARRAGTNRALMPGLAQALAHGLLHLCGHDHRRPAARKRMRQAEARLLEKL